MRTEADLVSGVLSRPNRRSYRTAPFTCVASLPPSQVIVSPLSRCEYQRVQVGDITRGDIESSFDRSKHTISGKPVNSTDTLNARSMRVVAM